MFLVDRTFLAAFFAMHFQICPLKSHFRLNEEKKHTSNIQLIIMNKNGFWFVISVFNCSLEKKVFVPFSSGLLGT